MIPVRLSVKNFLSYRDNAPILNLESIHIACLCGENGHGKSALLDAMTWALWGQARARRQEDLIHKGQTDMAVELDFLARDDLYRVSRRYSVSAGRGAGHPVLELQIASDDDSTFRPITGNTMSDTQARIVEILHMDYDTFINTAFLRQGDADRFTNARPTERKAILTEVLDLSYYEGLETKAKARVAGISTRLQETEVRISLHQQELDKKPEHEAHLSEVQQAVETLQNQSLTASADVESASQRVESLNAQKAELERFTPQLDNLRSRIRDLELRTRNHLEAVTRYQALLNRKGEIEEAHTRLTEAEAQRDRFARALSEKSPLDQQLAELTRTISVAHERLAGQVRQSQHRIDVDLEPKASRIQEYEQAFDALEPQRQELVIASTRMEQDRVELGNLSQELDTLNAASETMNSLERQRAELQQIIDLEQANIKNAADNINVAIERELRPNSERLTSLEAERQKLGAERENLQLVSSQNADARAELDKVEANIVILGQESDNLVQKMKDTRQKFDILEQGDALCPVCKQPLGDEGQSHLRSEYEKEGRESRRQHTENKAEQEKTKSQRQLLTDALLNMESAFDVRTRNLESASGRLNVEIENSKRAAGELAVQLPKLNEFRAGLASKDFCHKERQKLAELNTETRSLNFDPTRREQVQAERRDKGQSISNLEIRVNQGLLELQRDSDNFERNLKDARTAKSNLGPAREELSALQNRVDSEDYAQKTRVRAAELEAVIAELGYDAEEHASVDALASRLGEYAEMHRSLTDASERLPSEQALLSGASIELSELSDELSSAQSKQSDIETALLALPSSKSALKSAHGTLSGLESTLDDHRVRIGVLETQLQRCVEVEGIVKGLEKHRTSMVNERGLYSELVLAFGKNGIQALIIEDAIPQLEADANELLAKLTDNRMTLRLELKEGRRVRGTDALSEELDLSISDELGTRGYETFSGGETFRINFALRIALSRLLARRSGAPLRILFIDEGFGSQDATGQERLTEAIQSIQDDFEKIIVITHIDHVKEAFPVRIEVTKTELGSTFEIV